EARRPAVRQRARDKIDHAWPRRRDERDAGEAKEEPGVERQHGQRVSARTAARRALCAPSGGSEHQAGGRRTAEGWSRAAGCSEAAQSERGGCSSHGSSIAIAVASPPPMQRLATPRLPPCFLRAPSSVTRMRAPDAPIGWPSAHAPPCTLTLSCGMPCSFIAAIVTTANASLISKKSTSPVVHPVAR